MYDFYTPYWRVRYKDNNWEELSKREMNRFARRIGYSREGTVGQVTEQRGEDNAVTLKD